MGRRGIKTTMPSCLKLDREEGSRRARRRKELVIQVAMEEEQGMEDLEKDMEEG